MKEPSTSRKGPRPTSVLVEVLRWARLHVARLQGARFPMVRYQMAPVDFVREQIGLEPEEHQAEIMNAVAARDDAKVAVRSGQKCGKSATVIWLAMWFWASFPGARVFMTASTASQVNRVLWAELRNMVNRARARGGSWGDLPQNPERGLVSEDNRSIQGFTTRTIEAMAGLSGAHMLFIGDEASAFDAEMAQAIEGNTAGAGRIVWISNPTRAEGPFYDCFFSKKQFWHTMHLSSETLARKLAKEGRKVPGLATLKVIERWKEEYGEDSPFYLVRAKGEFVLDEQAKIIALHSIMSAQERWDEAADDGPLSIGADPAGDSGEGDEFVFAIVRGVKLLALYAFRGLSIEGTVAQALGFLKEFRRGGEIPMINIDAEGPIGSEFYGRMRALALHKQIHDPPNAFEAFGLKGSIPASREPTLYDRRRDELWKNLADWMRIGAIPRDQKLEQELYAPGWLVTTQGKRKATHKDVLREKLGRSPDRADALGLAVWQQSSWVPERPDLPNAEVNVGPGSDTENERGSGLDPFSGNKQGGGFSPWG